MSRPKVLITNFHPGDGGGHTTYILRLLSAGLADHFDIALAVPESSRLFTASQQLGVQVFPCEFPGKFKELPEIIRAIRRFGQIHRAFPFLAVHCNGARDHAIAAWWKAASNSRAQILRTHHAIRQTPGDPYHRWLHNRLTNLHIYVSHAQQGLNEAGNALKHPASVVIANGLDLESYSPAGKSEQVLREFGIQPGQMIFGTVGGTASHKRVDVMLRAVASLPDRSRAVVVVLGGEITGKKVSRLAESLGIRDHFRFAGLHVDVKPCISVFDVGFILSDSIETSSFAAREMMAMGVPMICSGYSGLLEVVEDGLNGFITTPGSVAEVASRVQDFLRMPEEQLKKVSPGRPRKGGSLFRAGTHDPEDPGSIRAGSGIGAMKLALVRRQFSATGGAELYAQRLIGALAARGHEVHLFAESWRDPLVGATLHPIAVSGSRSVRALRFAEAVHKELGREKFDCVFSLDRTLKQDVYRAGDGVHRMWLDRRRQFAPWWRQPLIGHGAFHRNMIALETRTLDPASTRHVIVNSEMVQREIEQCFKFPPERIHLVRNGVDVARFQGGKREETRAHFGVKDDEFLLLFVGSGWERKDCASFLRR